MNQSIAHAVREEIIEIKLRGRDEVRLRVCFSADSARTKILSAGIERIVGCGPFIERVRAYVSELATQPFVDELKLPRGIDHVALLLGELRARLRGEVFHPSDPEEEICHCRAVSLARIDAAIIAGAHRSDLVSLQTSAGTGCGTCRPVLESLIRRRLALVERPSSQEKR